jgi:hypothetical protein
LSGGNIAASETAGNVEEFVANELVVLSPYSKITSPE